MKVRDMIRAEEPPSTLKWIFYTCGFAIRPTFAVKWFRLTTKKCMAKGKIFQKILRIYLSMTVIKEEVKKPHLLKTAF